ncbi:MAG TPA: hypothetical protein VF456_08870 [Vicinamibacterales bacterium]
MIAFNQIKKLSGAVALIAASVSCGQAPRSGKSPVYLVIDSLTAGGGNFLQSDIVKMATSPAPCTTDNPCPTVFSDSASVVLESFQKDVTATAPSTNSAITISRYHVNYRRADGRNTPGVDVPYGFDGALTGTTDPSNGKLTLTFEIVRHVAKMESPLAQLATNAAVITTIADCTFYGQDIIGNDVNVTGSIQVDFGNFGDK